MHQSKSRKLWGVLLVAFLGIALLGTLGAILEPIFRYSYEENAAYGYKVRTDRLSGETCLASGTQEIATVLALERCDSTM